MSSLEKTDDFTILALEHLYDDAVENAHRLRVEAERAARLPAIWENLARYVRNDWLCHAQYLLEQEKDTIARIAEEDPQASTTVRQISEYAEKGVTTMMRRFPNLLETACDKVLPLDPEGRHPRYTFENNFFTLEIDEVRRHACLSDVGGKLLEFPADVGAVIEHVQHERTRLFSRPFDGRKYLALLRKGYVEYVKSQPNETDGVSMPIRRLFQWLSNKDKTYRLDEFIVDLSRLVQQGPHAVSGKTFELQQGRNVNQAVLLHLPDHSRYVSYLIFRKEQV